MKASSSNDYSKDQQFQYTKNEINKIIEKVVPIIAHKDDHDFFKKVLINFSKYGCYRNRIKFDLLINDLLTQHKENNNVVIGDTK